MRFWLQFGGIILGSLSLFNLSRKYLEIGLVPILADLTSFYEKMLFPIADIIIWIINNLIFFYNFTHIPKDETILYCLGAAAFIRLNVKIIQDEKAKLEVAEYMYLILGTIFWPLTLFALATSGDRKVMKLFPRWCLEIVYIVFVALILFAINHYSSGYSIP